MNIKEKIKNLETEIKVLYLATKDKRTPWYAKSFAFVIIGYFLSPLDIIPDFIPVLGYLDDLILIPLGVFILRKMISDELIDEYRTKIEKRPDFKMPTSKIAGVFVIFLWLICILWLLKIFLK